MAESELHPKKASSEIAEIPFGSSIKVSLAQFLNAPSPMEVTGLGITMEDKNSHVEKALAPMEVMPLGSSRLVKAEQ